MDSTSNYGNFSNDIKISNEVLGDIYSAGQNIEVNENVQNIIEYTLYQSIKYKEKVI